MARDPVLPPCTLDAGTTVAEILGDLAAASVYLQTLTERLQAGAVPDERDVQTIPPSTLLTLRQSCRLVIRDSDRALAFVSPRRAAWVEAVACQARDVEVQQHGRIR